MAQCPFCMRLFGKLHLRCDWCQVYFCEDCVKPQNHNCLAYDPSKLNPTTSATVNPYDKNIYDDFATEEDKEDVYVNEIRTEQEINAQNEAHIIEGNLIYQERIRLRVGQLKDECPICHSELNKVDEKCDFCTIMFCTYCIEPVKHSCVIYQHRYGEFPAPVIEPVLEPVKPDPDKVLISQSTVTVEPVNKSVIQPNVKALQEPTIIDGKEKKLSLWHRFLSLFGFGN